MALHGIALVLALVQGQAAPAATRLSSPDVLPHEFSLIRGLRELPDGRVLVSDWIEEVVAVADFRSGSVRPLGRKGSGPLEYRLPGTLLALPGDSTLLLDEGNGRFAVIAPDLRIARSYANNRPGAGHSIYPRAVDRQGRIYFTIPRWADRTPPGGDSASVARWTPDGDRIERLVTVLGSAPRKNSRVPGHPNIMFSPQDAWQADADGRIVVVRSDRYRIESHAPDGRVTGGPATPHTPLRTTRRDRTDFVARFLNSSAISGRGEGASGLAQLPAAMKSREAIERMVETQDVAPVRPAFTDRGPSLAPDGLLWVERSVPSGAAPLYDRFDRNGLRRAPVTLPAGRRLIALGARGIYAAAVDADGIETLERYAVPRP
jgi:hypothetical protein